MNKIFNDNTVFLFQGDSVTDCSRKRYSKSSLGDGYVKVFKEVYDILFPNHKVKFVTEGCRATELKTFCADMTRILLR